MRTLFTIATALGCMVLSASGQGATRMSTPTTDQKKQLQDAAEKLRQAQSNGELDKAKETARGLMGNLPGNLTDAAKAAMQSPEIKAQAAEAAKAAAKTLLPEAQRMLDARNEANADAPPAGTTATTTPADQPPAAEGPKPMLLQPLNDAPPEASAARKPVVVIEADNSVFNPDTGILIYTGNVRARHPQFYIECEELIVHLNQEEQNKKKEPQANKTDPILSKKKGAAEKPNPVNKAIASGPMVRIEKVSPEGELQRAFCRNAVYDGVSGLITMRDNPQVQTGNVMQSAISPDTIMTFDQKGKFNSNRPTRTVILNEDQ
ncbi:OstA-like protein [Prosthecobacter fusiformis]|uniref:OstA-like protein n=1 Tax=Prosthecobacter fusiformis TaxID=48464 RepID=A0A4R7RR76_9BACT|nr:LptA/OstA family protein [Prosthecobacter fusiformis]TDU68062.1 OstA-like protein [Prosthecobacter fusiformis]